MLKYHCVVMGFLMVLCLFFTSLTGASLGPSEVVSDAGEDCYRPGEMKTLCFSVTNASPDGEAITDIDLGFPPDWTVSDCCREGKVCPASKGYVRV